MKRPAGAAEGYQHLDDPQKWFNQIRELAAKHGFPANAKEYKKTPTPIPARSARHPNSSA